MKNEKRLLKSTLVRIVIVILVVGCCLFSLLSTFYPEGVDALHAVVADVNAKDENGHTPLHKAVSANHKLTAKVLIARGAGIDAKTEAGATALYIAAKAGHRDMVKLLISKGADVHAKKSNGATPLHGAALRGRKEITEMLIAEGADVSAKAAWLALFDSDEAMASLSDGVDDGVTPMHLAAFRGHKDIAELLIAKGADVNAKGVYGDTPLLLAGSRQDMARFLIGKGADVNVKGRGGRTPLHFAVPKVHRPKDGAERVELVALLIAKGADVKNAKDNDGVTPLHAAARYGHKDVAELLIANGADVNAKGNQGRTALQWAAKGYKDVVELLIANGADVNAKDKEGRTPLTLAKDRHHTEIVELLRKEGAKE